MAGHSHWKQVKHKKGAADTKRGQVFSKLVKEITIAARAGSTDPATNPRLRSALERAAAVGLPKENRERAVARASGSGPDAELFEVLYEAAAPGGIAILVEAITDNRNRTVNELKHLLSLQGARLAEPGSLAWNFEKIGVMEIAAGANPTETKEDMENAIIESGAADFHDRDGIWRVETAYADLVKVRGSLERAGIAVKETGHSYKPRAPVALHQDARASLERLLDALSEHDDIQEAYTNLRE